jgi:hypothetical protein
MIIENMHAIGMSYAYLRFGLGNDEHILKVNTPHIHFWFLMKQ